MKVYSLLTAVTIVNAKKNDHYESLTGSEEENFWERELQNSQDFTDSPTPGPPLLICNLSPTERRSQILDILNTVSDPNLLSTSGTPENDASDWLIGQDSFTVCPEDTKLIQRYVMALFYYSTEGESWSSCGQGDLGCAGTVFLAPTFECEWFGLTCNQEDCITEIEFESNNVAGTIPFELEQLGDLEVLSLEQGGLVSTIPASLGNLGNLRILDLDFNSIGGTIPEEIYSLNNLEQLDLNSNSITGTLSESIGNLIELRLLQLYENLMTGTIPVELGDCESLVIGEFFNNTFTGSMPNEVCANRAPNGAITGLTSDCFPFPVPQIECTCCTGCAVF